VGKNPSGTAFPHKAPNKKPYRFLKPVRFLHPRHKMIIFPHKGRNKKPYRFLKPARFLQDTRCK